MPQLHRTSADQSLSNPRTLSRGRLMAAISRSIVAIRREHYGRGPMNAKTYAVDDIIVVVMRASRYTSLEQTIIDDDGADRVVAMRHNFQLLVADRYKRAIEELTGRTVVAFLSQAHVEPDITIEIFFLDAPLPDLEMPILASTSGRDSASSSPGDLARNA